MHKNERVTNAMVEAACKAFSEAEAVYPDGSAKTQITDWFKLDAQDAVDFGVLQQPKWDGISDIRGMQHEWYVASVIERPMRSALSAALSALVEEQPAVKANEADLRSEPHPDEIAVDRFSAAMAERMKAKLAKKRGQGVTGWDDPEVCHIDYLVSLLLEQIHERAVLDPIDIANIAMMIHERGETPSHGR